MKNEDRLLPHLNQLFLQRQSYNFHKRRILEIKTKRIKPSMMTEISAKPSCNNSLSNSKVGSVSLKSRHKT